VNNLCNNESASDQIKTKIQTLRGLAKALHCPTRWEIVEIIGNKEVRTEEIMERLRENGVELTRPGLYYHLSELREAGVIEVADYSEAGRGAPEKIWRLAMKKIEISLV
jgi:DNA-binding transcriptional ArsR family regulator